MAVLSRRFGVHRLETCEDAAQWALLRAVETWRMAGVPEERGAWLYRVAYRRMLDVIRQERVGHDIDDVADPREPDPVFMDGEVADDLLRTLFYCADPAIPREAQLVLALKTLCGFSTEEIALRLLTSPEAVHKRLQRARAVLSAGGPELTEPDRAAMIARVPSVLQMLYLLFTEGYGSARPEALLRRELCDEAIRLTRLLVAHPIGASPAGDALLSLMLLHAARASTRLDASGALLLLEDQDRSRWDFEAIAEGVAYLRRSSGGLSPYHVEASIAAEHCLASSYERTRWEVIAQLYETLDRIAPSPLNTLNRAIAVAEGQGPRAGLAILVALEPPAWLLTYYLWDATLGELHRRCGEHERAAGHLARALEAAPTNAERTLIEARLARCRAEQR